MKADPQIKVLLLAIVIFLALIAVRPYAMPMTAHADSTAGYPLFIEPGVTMLSPAIFYGSFNERIIAESLIEAASSTDMSASVYECGWTWPHNRLLGKVKPNCLKSPLFGKFASKLPETPFLGRMARGSSPPKLVDRTLYSFTENRVVREILSRNAFAVQR